MSIYNQTNTQGSRNRGGGGGGGQGGNCPPQYFSSSYSTAVIPTHVHSNSSNTVSEVKSANTKYFKGNVCYDKHSSNHHLQSVELYKF